MRGHDDRGTRGHGVAHDHGGAGELLEECLDVTGSGLVAVARERRRAVAVSAELHGDDAVSRRDDRRHDRAVARPEVSHAGDEHDEGAVPLELPRDMTVSTFESLDSGAFHCASLGEVRHPL